MRSSGSVRWFVTGTACILCVIALTKLARLSHSAYSTRLLSQCEMQLVHGGGSESDSCGNKDATVQSCQPYGTCTSYVFETQNPNQSCAAPAEQLSGVTVKSSDAPPSPPNTKLPRIGYVDCSRSCTHTTNAQPGMKEVNGTCVNATDQNLYCVQCTATTGAWETWSNYYCVDP